MQRWSAWGIGACPGVVGDVGTAEIASQFSALRSQFLSDLSAYQTAGAHDADIDPNIVDGFDNGDASAWSVAVP